MNFLQVKLRNELSAELTDWIEEVFEKERAQREDSFF